MVQSCTQQRCAGGAVCGARLGVNGGVEQTWESALYPLPHQQTPVATPLPDSPDVAISPSEALPQASPHCFTCLLPLLLPSYHPRSSQLPEGKGTFYHIPALLTALQGLPHHLPNKI